MKLSQIISILEKIDFTDIKVGTDDLGDQYVLAQDPLTHSSIMFIPKMYDCDFAVALKIIDHRYNFNMGMMFFNVEAQD